MKKSISIFITVFLFAVASSIIYHGCKKKDSGTGTGTGTATASCSDGIQNQGETGIDCGGPCSACPPTVNTLCDGNGTNTYLPLAVNNKWEYLSDYTGYPDVNGIEKITSTQ